MPLSISIQLIETFLLRYHDYKSGTEIEKKIKDKIILTNLPLGAQSCDTLLIFCKF